MYSDLDLQGVQPDIEEKKETFIVFVALVVNERTGTIWLCMFEAPTNSFSVVFPKYGQKMLNNMFFLPTA